MQRLRAFVKKPVDLVWGHVLAAAAVIGGLLSATLIVVAVIAFALNDAQNAGIEANENAIKSQRRLDALDAQRARQQQAANVSTAVRRALRVCVADPVCRRQLRGAIRSTDLRPSDVPRLRPRADTTPSGSSGGSGSGSGGNGSGGTASPSAPDTTARNPRQPSGNPRRPANPAAPPGQRPSAPVPAPSAPPPPATPPTRPPARPAPSPIPTPPSPAPSVPTPTVPPVVPPVTVPAPVQVCTPVVQVNCRNAAGRLVGPSGAAADPTSNSGRGNQGDRLCDRVKAPCDEKGNPVFPTGLIRLP